MRPTGAQIREPEFCRLLRVDAPHLARGGTTKEGQHHVEARAAGHSKQASPAFKGFSNSEDIDCEAPVIQTFLKRTENCSVRASMQR
jgi:hypothetical protein